MYTMPMRGESVIHIGADLDTNLDIAPWVVGGQALLTIVVDSGVTINSTNAALGAIYSSKTIDPARSKVTIRNNGTILGCNGAGGRGGGESDGLPGQTGNPGHKGCDAINLNCRIILYNAQGQIRSGGGGGGGGAGRGSAIIYGGGGGGGYLGGSGGGGTSGRDGFPGASSQYGTAAGGSGEGGGGGYGGACNGHAIAGSAGGNDGGTSGGAGGSAGLAINSNGHGVTVVSGGANILGAIDLEV